MELEKPSLLKSTPESQSSAYGDVSEEFVLMTEMVPCGFCHSGAWVSCMYYHSWPLVRFLIGHNNGCQCVFLGHTVLPPVRRWLSGVGSVSHLRFGAASGPSTIQIPFLKGDSSLRPGVVQFALAQTSLSQIGCEWGLALNQCVCVCPSVCLILITLL